MRPKRLSQDEVRLLIAALSYAIRDTPTVEAKDRC